MQSTAVLEPPPNPPNTGSQTGSAGPSSPDYDLSYRDEFWGERAYEDRADRIALRGLLPRAGRDLLDIGAGFGRLADEYAGHDRVTLVDTSPEMLAAAGERYGGDPRFRLIRADANALPFPAESFDTIVAIRLLVHLRDPQRAFAEVRRLLRPGGSFIVEFPNRRHALSIVRWLARRQTWSPMAADAHEYLEGHFAHQPSSIADQLHLVGLPVDAVRGASLLRSAWLKRHIGAELLGRFEAPLQAPLGRLYLSPSVYFRASLGDRAKIENGAAGRRAQGGVEV